MHPTRRLWGAIALVAVLAILAVVAARPLLLAGSGLVGAWVLVRQHQFTRALEGTIDDLQVDQSVSRSGVRTEETVPITLTATLASPSSLGLEIDGGVPTGAAATSRLSVSLDPGESSGEETIDVSWPIAGRHRFGEPTVTASNGFVRETLSAGTAPTVTVEPRGPRTIHVGEGGDEIPTAYGDHDGGRRGAGLEPAELREYQPGDTANRIDWKATARLSTPHVREYEAETDRKTLLVVDHRRSLATGRPDETALDYLREVALTVTASARRLGDPVGLVTVGDDGITSRVGLSTTPATYDRVRRRLLDLEPTADTESGDSASSDDVGRSYPGPSPLRTRRRTTAADARTALATLDGDDAFAATLRPFYAARGGYRDRIESEPLYRAVEATHGRETGSVWTVIATDDSRPAELRETVSLARSAGDAVLVLLAPAVLYEPDGLADLERAYDRYVEFEQLRRELARLDRVTALEVGPADRLSAVLSASRPRARGGRT